MSNSETAATFSLRPATLEDLPEVTRIEALVHVAPWDEAAFVGEMQKPFAHVLVMTDDETDSVIAGYVVFWLQEHEAEILNIAVALNHRGLGLARRMILQVVSLAMKQGLGRLVLDVRKSNLAAIQLYQSLRFTITQVRKGFYSNGEDAYTMTLDLHGEGVSPQEREF